MKRNLMTCLVAALALSGCAMGGSMSPEAMAQNAKAKNAVVGCVSGTGIYGRGTAVYVDTDKINDNQTVSVDQECKVSVTGSKAAPK
jgi:hypothetical protein